MECNKDEAIRAKIIAEKKLTEKDFASAKRFVLKAQNLFPELEGLPQMLTTLEVYIAAGNKVMGEVDWYGVLGVKPSADEEAIRKQYRKLALLLHPDKNKSIGADGAFKLLSEAWSLLSDKLKRLAYNQKRFSKGLIQQNLLTNNGTRKTPPNANGFHNNKLAKKAKNTGVNQVQVNSIPNSQPQRRTDTFWTLCEECRMHYEYLRVYLDNTLLCPNCHKAFVASETPAPNFPRAPSSSSSQQKNQVPNGYQINPGKGSSSSNYANAPQKVEKRKREQEQQGGSSVQKGPSKKRKTNNNLSSVVQQNTPNSISVAQQNKPVQKDSMQLDIRSLLMQKARSEIQQKLEEWHLDDVAKAAEAKKEKAKDKGKGKAKEENSSKYNNFGVYRSVGGSTDTSAGVPSQEIIEPVAIEPVVMPVPDPDFHDFDQDRTERAFREDQVWASYDDDDGMPRFYAMIHKVISLSPFQMEISWLNSKTNSEFGPLGWISSGFRKTCGDFRMGKHEINKSLNSFSHEVKWAKGPRGNVCVYPKRGEVWALYRNWSSDWNEHTPDETIHKYDMVEVLDDYNDFRGIYIAPLIKVSGFKTVFRAQMNPDKVRRIPKEEMFRFSHQVPHHMLTGLEGQNAPKGCLELDPASVPLELLQVIEKDSDMVVEDNNRKDGKEFSEIKNDISAETKLEIKKGEVILTYSRKQHRS